MNKLKLFTPTVLSIALGVLKVMELVNVSWFIVLLPLIIPTFIQIFGMITAIVYGVYMLYKNTKEKTDKGGV